MTITFESDKAVIVYALAKIISHARDNQYILLAQSVWWISLIIGLKQDLVLHIDNLKIRSKIRIASKELSGTEHIHPSRITRVQTADADFTDSCINSVSKTETDIHNEVIENCELFLE
jgi:hypothetical protein